MAARWRLPLGLHRAPHPLAASLILATMMLGLPASAGAGQPQGANKRATKARLASVRNCAELRAHEYAQLLKHSMALPVRQERRPSDPPTPMVLSSGAEPETSETNVQEAGVDEPDTVKARGGIVFALASGALHAVDAHEPNTQKVGRLALPGISDAEMLLDGERLLVLARRPYPSSAVAGLVTSSLPGQGGAASTLIEIDVRRPHAMRIVRTLTFEGRYVSARRQGAVVRVVLTTPPPPVVVPAPAEGEPYLTYDELQRAGAEAMASAGPGRLMPDATLTDVRSGAIHKFIPGCQRVRHPHEFSGLDVLTVLTIDLERGVEPVDIDAVLASGDEVYASQDSLYVATHRYDHQAGETVARVHRFETGPDARTVYRSSGSVRGNVLNQFAFSQHDGYLRVASTVPARWSVAGQESESESFVTVLGERDGELVRVGRVGGLGHGEQIRGVRFLGDRGYVVTFRQTDPLYTIDLSDPRDPRVRGELKIPGYSAYLHPVGDDLLLGVGRDGDLGGRLAGAQISLFDVSDPGRPRRIDQVTTAIRSQSPVEWDHHAFLWSARSRLAIVPLHDYGTGFNGVVGVRVGRDGLAEVGRLAHGGAASVQRSLIVDDRLLTFSWSQVVTGRVGDLARIGSLALDPPP